MRSGIHYGWIIAAVCMLMIVGVCLISTGIAVSLNALRGQYGFSGTETGLITTITGGTALAAAFISD